VNPKYILVNETSNNIEYRQTFQTVSYSLPIDFRKPLIWTDKESNKLIQLKIMKYGWSSEIDIR